MNAKELRELDVWIAEHVMNLPTPFYSTMEMQFPGPQPGTWIGNVKQYTTDPAAAMEVEKKCVEHLPMHLEICFDANLWWVGRPDMDSTEAVSAATLELAICLFAKKLFGKDAQ